MKKVLVTGASGFVGCYVVEALLQRNYSIIATSANPAVVSGKPWLSKVKYLPFDLESFSASNDYFSYFDRPDMMIHLAWEGLPHYKALYHFEDNLPRHYAFLKNMIVNGLKDLTVTGTCLEYGFVEGKLSEEMKTDPSNAYAIAKDTLRKFLVQLATEKPISLKWARLFYMYGQGQNPNSIFSQLEKAIIDGKEVFNMSAGEQLRDYLPVEKVAEYICAIATQTKVEGIINCCSGKPVKLKDLVEEFLQKRRSNIKLNLGYYPYPDYEPMEFWGDNSKLRLLLKQDIL